MWGLSGILVCLAVCVLGAIHTSVHPPAHQYVPHYIQVTWMPSVHLSDISVYVSTLVCPSVDPLLVRSCLTRPVIPVNQHNFWSLAVSCMADLGTLVFWDFFYCRASVCLVWMPMDVCSDCRLVLIVLFFCSVFIISQASATTATTTTSPVTVVCCSTSSLLMTYHGPTLMGLPLTLGQHGVVCLHC